ncbi:TPA: hypothetical protein ENS27_06995 [bacterium]|nr:hypothetical protein [bacterium]
MKRYCFIIAIILLSLPLYAIAIPPSPAGGNALDLSGGKQGYYYVEDINNSFDDKLLKHAFTIEFWFCPARVTKPGEAWNIIGKMPVYEIGLVYCADCDVFKKEWLSLRYLLDRAMYRHYNMWDISAKENYEPEWHHFAVQASVYDNLEGEIATLFLDGVSSGLSGSQGGKILSIDSDEPLCVGGFPTGTKTVIWTGEGQTVDADIKTFDGLIDELRISNVARYDSKFPGEIIEVQSRFEPDKYTVALWHFDEEIGSLQYKDSSGNGHTLFASGFDNTTSVNQKQMLPVLWGNIRK